MKKILKNLKYISKGQATRGDGSLERFLALQRIKKAKTSIQQFLKLPHQKLLDIGCGTYPIGLLVSDFSEKYGMDRVFIDAKVFNGRFKFFQQDITCPLPFESESLEAVTMLAVFEHIKRESITPVLKEIYRVLKPGGVFVMTTPGHLTDFILKILAAFKLVSAEEIHEHETYFKTIKIVRSLSGAGFKVHNGNFQFRLNRWFVGIKE